MAVHGRAFSPLFLVLFLAVSFGTGLIFVTASQQSTEGRSKASGFGPYVTPLASPTTNPWDECMRWPAEHFGDDDYCLSTYRQYKEAMDADWRCKQKWLFLGMCNDGEPPIELPNAPFPTGSPKP